MKQKCKEKLKWCTQCVCTFLRADSHPQPHIPLCTLAMLLCCTQTVKPTLQCDVWTIHALATLLLRVLAQMSRVLQRPTSDSSHSIPTSGELLSVLGLRFPT